MTVVKEEGGSMTVNGVTGWQKLSVAVESGACESVIRTDTVKGYPIVKHDKPIWYQNCNGGTMPNDGEQHVPVVMPSGDICYIPFQNTSVVKPLGSVKHMCSAGSAI